MIKIPSIHISFNLLEPLEVPVNYHHLLQAFVYSLFSKQDASFIHDSGFHFNNRVYKLFTYSNIQSEQTAYDKRSKQLTFFRKISLTISSIIPNYVSGIANYLLLKKEFSLNGTKMFVETVKFEQNNVSSNVIVVKALSPITVYSTYEKRNGTKITHYFSPADKVFEHLIEENFARKYQAFTGEGLENEKELVSVRPIKVTKKNKIITNYKSTWVIGWTGIYELTGKAEYLSFLLNTGVGSKNSAGFGCVVPIHSKQNDEGGVKD